MFNSSDTESSRCTCRVIESTGQQAVVVHLKAQLLCRSVPKRQHLYVRCADSRRHGVCPSRIHRSSAQRIGTRIQALFESRRIEESRSIFANVTQSMDSVYHRIFIDRLRFTSFLIPSGVTENRRFSIDYRKLRTNVNTANGASIPAIENSNFLTGRYVHMHTHTHTLFNMHTNSPCLLSYS